MFRPIAFVHALAVAATLGVLAGSSTVQPDPPPASEDKIVVRVTALRNSKGSVRCSLYNSGDGFPQSQKHIVGRARAVPSDKSATCTFARPARGQKFAVVIHHDENDDGAFQRNVLGIPLEGYGFSRNVRPVLSAPSFEACQFLFAGGHSSLDVTTRY